MKVRRFVLNSLPMLLTLSLVACGIYETKIKPGSNNEINTLGAPGTRLSFTQVNEAIIQPSCTECHRQGKARGGVLLDTYANVIENLAGVKAEAVDSGDMPPSGPLPLVQRNALQKWIEDGAPNTVDQTPAPSVTPVPTATPDSSVTPTPTPTPVATATPVASASPVLLATYQSIKEQVIDNKCLKCHMPSGSAKDYPLDTYEKMMAQGEMVISGDPSKSTLVIEIEDGSMPPRRANLPSVTAEELSAIKIWITNGAKP